MYIGYALVKEAVDSFEVIRGTGSPTHSMTFEMIELNYRDACNTVPLKNLLEFIKTGTFLISMSLRKESILFRIPPIILCWLKCRAHCFENNPSHPTALTGCENLRTFLFSFLTESFGQDHLRIMQ